MSQNLNRRRVCAGLAAAAGTLGLVPWRSALGGVASKATAAAAPAPLLVGFVYVTPVGTAGWTYQHELGRRALVRALGARVKTVAVADVAEGPDSERVMRDLARQGAGLIFATSFGYLEPALRVAADFPAVKFEHTGGYRNAPNLATYDARYYEARWPAGWLAGSVSRSGRACYVAGFAVPEVIRGIDAFTLGMRAANPEARVRVLWLDTWFDPAKEHDAALTLIDQGADVLTHHSASTAVAQAAQARFAATGVRVIPYPSDMRAFAPDAQLCAIEHHWGGFYTAVAQSVLDGTWKNRPVWGGIASGMVDIDAVDPTLPAALRHRLAAQRQAIVAGTRLPFAAPLVDTAGVTRLASGALDDRQIKAIDWFVEGVEGAVPKRP